MGVNIFKGKVNWGRSGEITFSGVGKVIDPSLKHYKIYLSNEIWHMDDPGVKMHRITLDRDYK